MALNLNLISAINSESPKTYERHITCPKGNLETELCFQVSLVIWRSLGGSKLKSDKRNLLSPQTYKKIYYMPKGDLVKVINLGHYKSLEVVFRSFGGYKLKSDSAINSASPNT